MKNLITALTTTTLLHSLIPNAYAKSGPCPQGFESLCTLTNPESYGNLFGNIIQILLTIAAITSLIYLIWGGIRWIKANGDKAQLDQARQTIIGAIIGLIISFLAFFFINLVASLFTGDGQLHLEIPTLVHSITKVSET